VDGRDHTWLLLNVALPEEVPAPSDRFLIQSGIKHEDEALQYFLKKYGDDCTVITGDESRSKEDNIAVRLDQTIAAMSGGRQIIYHGILAPDDRVIKVSGTPETMIPRGETDFLFRVDKAGSGRFGGYHYQPFQTENGTGSGLDM